MADSPAARFEALLPTVIPHIFQWLKYSKVCIYISIYIFTTGDSQVAIFVSALTMKMKATEKLI